MQKGKLIEKHIGEGLIPKGFSYEGRKGDSWIFEKKVKTLVQTISFHEYRFDKNMISFDLYTNVRGKGVVTASDMEGVQSNSYLPGYWKYEEEQEFIEILKEIKELLIKQGIKALGKLSVPDKIVATNEMYHELYLKHSELAACFQQEHNIQLVAFDDENIDKWFEVIEERVEELKKGEYDDAKGELVKIAAFLGDALIHFKGGEWSKFERENYESCSVEGVKARRESGINILHVLIGGYGYNGIDWTKEAYKWLIE